MIAREAAVPGAMSGRPGKPAGHFVRSMAGQNEGPALLIIFLLISARPERRPGLTRNAFSAGFQRNDNCTPAPPGGTKRSSRR